jgi:hypothetical protein
VVPNSNHAPCSYLQNCPPISRVFSDYVRSGWFVFLIASQRVPSRTCQRDYEDGFCVVILLCSTANDRVLDGRKSTPLQSFSFGARDWELEIVCSLTVSLQQGGIEAVVEWATCLQQGGNRGHGRIGKLIGFCWMFWWNTAFVRQRTKLIKW